MFSFWESRRNLQLLFIRSLPYFNYYHFLPSFELLRYLTRNV